MITEDAVILLSLLRLECRELVRTFAEAAWTPEALTGQLLLPVLSSQWLRCEVLSGMAAGIPWWEEGVCQHRGVLYPAGPSPGSALAAALRT